MNKAIKTAALTVLGIALSVPVWGAAKYGDASIQKGKLTVLREGRRLTFDESDRQVEINHLDVIRVGRNSNVVLSTIEKATITLGSNAVFQVKPWQRKEEKGFFRMLFGRMRAKISGLVGSERFSVQSATATIGVKGTEEVILVNVQGDATLGVTENEVELRGRGGGQLNVLEGAASGVVGGVTPAKSFEIDASALADLNSVGPTTDDAIRVPLGQLLVANGVVSQEQVDRSERGAREGVELPVAAVGPDGGDILDNVADDVQDAANEAGGITAPISIDFEN